MTAARLRTIVLLIVVLLSKLLILLITMLQILLLTMLILLITMLLLLITALPQDSRLLLFTLLLADHLQSLRSSADSWNQFFKLDLLTILVKRHQQYRFFNNDINSSGMEAIQQDFFNLDLPQTRCRRLHQPAGSQRSCYLNPAK